MITAVSTFAVSLQSYMIQGSIAKYGGWHIGFPAVDASFVQERAHDQAVSRTASFENIGYAALSGGKNPDKPYLFIAGFNEDKASPDTLPVTLVSGRMPDNSGEILVPSHLAANGGIKLAEGDTLTLVVGDRMNGNQRLNQHDAFLRGISLRRAQKLWCPGQSGPTRLPESTQDLLLRNPPLQAIP
ncbi:hypothetical protein ACFTAO_22380 [Paenibacillus rhizoplanae]